LYGYVITTEYNGGSTGMDDYFEPQGLGKTIFQERYARTPDETWEEAARRVAQHVAKAEANGKVVIFEEKFFNELVTNRFMPGGRIWYGAGRPKAQLLNCFVIPVGDSREGWGQMLYDTTVISGTGGGIGANYSDVRYRGAPIAGTGGVATGAVSAMRMQDGVAEELRQGGGRRAALMQCLNLHHPDLPEFLDAKLNPTPIYNELGEEIDKKSDLSNANVSVVLDMDPAEFVNKVRMGDDIEFEWNGLPTGESMNAAELWERIVENAWKSGEPGVLNGFTANELNNIYYYEKLISTNPCGEIWLGPYDCCCLGNVVLPRFVHDGEFDWDQLDESVRIGIRFLDNVLTVNDFPLQEIKDKCQKNRRIGLGVMGLHTMLLELGLTYDGEDGLAFVDKLFDFIKNTAYDESATLASEKGPFPGYASEFLKSGFMKTVKRGIRNKIKHHGIRNCALMTVPPTGTTGMVCGVSTSLEPLFAPAYWRRWKVTDENGYDKDMEELVVSDEYHKFGDLAVGAYDISVRAHFEMQKTVQKHIDNAVSKTINLPEDFPVDELSDLWLEYLPYCKGTTFYRAGSRGKEPLKVIPIGEIDSLLESRGFDSEEGTIDEMNSMDCVSGVCSI
jgi:ribonucleoside-diphosphate reductase alpha chain